MGLPRCRYCFIPCANVATHQESCRCRPVDCLHIPELADALQLLISQQNANEILLDPTKFPSWEQLLHQSDSMTLHEIPARPFVLKAFIIVFNIAVRLTQSTDEAQTELAFKLVHMLPSLLLSVPSTPLSGDALTALVSDRLRLLIANGLNPPPVADNVRIVGPPNPLGKAQALINRGLLSKAMQALDPTPLAQPTVQQLQDLFKGNTLPVFAALPAIPPLFSAKEINAAIKCSDKTSAPGPSGLRPAYLH